MYLSEEQENTLIQLYWDIHEYAVYLEKETYHPYEEIAGWAKTLKNTIGEDKIFSYKQH